MLEKFDKQIGGSVYEVTQLDARTGYKLGLRISKALARGALAAGKDGGEKLQLGSLLTGLAGIIADLEESDLDYAIDCFKAKTDVRLGEGSAPSLAKIFDMQFAGKYEEMIQWLEFSFEVNYGPLVAMAKARLRTAVIGIGAKKPEPAKDAPPS